MSFFRKKTVISTQVFLTFALLVTIASQFQNCAGAKFDQDPNEVVLGTPDPSPTPSPSPTPEVFKTIKPALALRGAGCISCHANVNASFVTDMGFNSSFYRKDLSPYSNFGVDQLNLGGSMYVPNNTGDNLASYVNPRGELTVETLSKVYIGAPTVARLRAVFGGATGLDYKPASSASPALTGFTNSGSAYKATGTVNCDGDLLVDGHLYIKNATIKSIKGCRIYVTGSVFISAVTSDSYNGDGDHNVQISSAVSINMGLNANDVRNRYRDDPKPEGTVQPTRAFPNPATLGNAVIAAAALYPDLITAEISASPLQLKTQHFSRLLLNAPRVDSRYHGNFTGSVIAELAMMAINNFVFSYDPVFTRVKILPKLAPSDYLDLKY